MYLFYIDESGNLDISNHDSWLYTLTAIGLFEHNWPKFYFPIAQRKRQLMNRIYKQTGEQLKLHDCEVKSTQIRIQKRRAESKFLPSLTEDELTALVELYYSQMSIMKSVCISVAIDKRELKPYFNQTKLHLKAWELLCERIENYMREHHRKHRAILVVDDVSPHENISLAGKHAYFQEQSTSANLQLQRIIETPFFVRSELAEGVQLADLCAYNVYHSIVYQKPDYPFFQRILPYYYNSANTPIDKIDGLKVFPESSEHLAEWLTRLKQKPRFRSGA